MNRSRLFGLSLASAVTLIAFVPRGGSAQAVTPAPARIELHASRATSIQLDGKLDEKEWSTAEAATNFTQRFPDPGHPATMRTEVRILYDANAIYVGARMFDPHPDSITAPLARRDPGNVDSDWIDVIFDSYNDRRTGYRFGINPVGTKLDVYHFNDSDDDNSWDALWDVATSIDSLGWTAEYRIPLSQLR
ncbi:MAG: carbohydrate binding family 9 domain-containing protein, partial [Gemmatimonadales bacterium]